MQVGLLSSFPIPRLGWVTFFFLLVRACLAKPQCGGDGHLAAGAREAVSGDPTRLPLCDFDFFFPSVL